MDRIEAPALLPGAQAISREEREGTGAGQALTSDFETFLTLLTAQLRNQDPLQPIESTEFVAQLASFSTVEQLVATNERLDGLAAAAAAREVAALSGWIGLDAAAADGSFLATGDRIDFAVPVIEGATTVAAEIVDGRGTVRALVADLEAGRPGTWDGRDTEGGVPLGELLSVRLVHRKGEEILAQTPGLVFRQVDALSGGAEGAVLRLADGREIAPSAVAGLRRGDSDGSRGPGEGGG